MKLIPRYIIRQMSVMAVYALLAFLALYSFFEVIKRKWAMSAKAATPVRKWRSMF